MPPLEGPHSPVATEDLEADTAPLTIGIKALNEERHIAASLESALAAVALVGGEVVLADSGSTDATIAIARRYPAVRIVQLADPAQRSCGTGAQLAFQAARGRYFYLLDGDMVLDPAFVTAGIAFLEANPGHAAVGGIVREAETSSIEFQIRQRNDREKGSAISGDVDRLDCGGLYRSAAVRSVGWFADRNLHAFEEYELGARLRAAAWKLARLGVHAVDHHGHATGGYRLLWRRIRSGYAGGAGEVLRAALVGPHRRAVLLGFSNLRHAAVVVVWWLVVVALLFSGKFVATGIVLLLPALFLSWRRGGVRHGLYSLATWNVIAIGLLQGIVRRRLPPDQAIPARTIAPDALP
ncbi:MULTISPECIES: glycosyltransferase family 2 protein [unclassified Sphingomonas]|uniref:glycosyltransferase family 2 protein n=1 Tax=unclassified Sphingomonas TaxID=196159 RepID=UPI0009EBE1B7|nr:MULTISPECIES: glycosyltransferase [unclassified Sphingomonas]